METKKLEFRGGPYVSMLPFGFFIVGSFVLAALNIATSEGFWILALVGLVIGMFLCKDPAAYFDTICNGTASNLLTTAIFCWLWSGAVAGILKASGLVNGLIWLGLETKLTGGLFVGFTFLLGCVYSTSTGTSFGTVTTLTMLLYPAGICLGASPWWLAAAIISGAGFGDNLAPISDTTIVAASTMRVDVPGLVKNRIPYTLFAGVVSLVILVIGGTVTQTSVSISQADYNSLIAQASPKGLLMLIPAVLIIILALNGKSLMEALSIGGIVAIVIALVSGLLDVNTLVTIDRTAGTVGGTIVDSINGWYGVIILIFLIFALAHIMTESGAMEMALNKVESKFVKTRAHAEIFCWFIIALSAFGLCNNITSQIVAGPIMLKVADKYHLSHYRIANFSDAVQAFMGKNLPWGGESLVFCVTAAGVAATYTWCPTIASPVMLIGCGIYPLAIGLTFLVCAITGIGRKFDEGMDMKNLGYSEDYFKTMD